MVRGAEQEVAMTHTMSDMFLLKRDLDPASNNNDPMWLEKAA